MREKLPSSAVLTHLTASESALYRASQDHQHGDRVRVEQERVQYPAIEAARARLDAGWGEPLVTGIEETIECMNRSTRTDR